MSELCRVFHRIDSFYTFIMLFCRYSDGGGNQYGRGGYHHEGRGYSGDHKPHYGGDNSHRLVFGNHFVPVSQ